MRHKDHKNLKDWDTEDESSSYAAKPLNVNTHGEGSTTME
nr:MAG TPA: hypothetical protein [Caudoviricetes sp.]